MNRAAIGAFLALVATQSAVAVEARDLSLERVAAQLGFRYSYLGPEDAVTLTRPGLTILVRSGEQLYDVNDRTEAMDGPAPRFSNGDILVSDAFAARLRQLSMRYASAASQDSPPIRVSRPWAQPFSGGGEMAQQETGGAITGLEVRQLAGTQVLAVRGKAPGKLPITLTLVGTFSMEIPDVVLNRTSLVSDAAGTFLATIPIAPGYFRGAILTVTASSVPGVASASAQVIASAPNGNVPIPADNVKPSDR